MKEYGFVFVFLIASYLVSAQKVKVYGQLTYAHQPAADVLITVFEKGQFYKKFVTNRKGEFRFYIDKSDYAILFYKPGFEPFSSTIINKLETDIQLIPINSELIKSKYSNDSTLANSKMIAQLKPAMAKSYLQYVYQYERKSKSPARTDSTSLRTRHLLLKQAIAERERFKNYKRSTENEITTTTIGTDIYLMTINSMKGKLYFKNDKPITEATYFFETTRRYEGILINKKDVKKFEKYEPILHLR